MANKLTSKGTSRWVNKSETTSKQVNRQLSEYMASTQVNETEGSVKQTNRCFPKQITT